MDQADSGPNGRRLIIHELILNDLELAWVKRGVKPDVWDGIPALERKRLQDRSGVHSRLHKKLSWEPKGDEDVRVSEVVTSESRPEKEQ